MGSIGRKLTDKRCKNCKEKLEYWWAEDIGGYSCLNCGAHYSIEDYWDKKSEKSKNKSTEKVVINKETKEIVGKVFMVCKKCGKVLSQKQKGACPDCGGRLAEMGIISGIEAPNRIFVARSANK